MSISSKKLIKNGVIVLIASLIADLLLGAGYVAAFRIDPAFIPLQPVPIAALTTFGVIGAVIVYALIARMSARPRRTFRVTAVVVLLLSWLADLGVAVAPPAAGFHAADPLQVLLPASLHLTPAILSMLLLPRSSSTAPLPQQA